MQCSISLQNSNDHCMTSNNFAQNLISWINNSDSRWTLLTTICWFWEWLLKWGRACGFIVTSVSCGACVSHRATSLPAGVRPDRFNDLMPKEWLERCEKMSAFTTKMHYKYSLNIQICWTLTGAVAVCAVKVTLSSVWSICWFLVQLQKYLLLNTCYNSQRTQLLQFSVI